MTREEVFQHIKKQYGAEPEYPWMRTPKSAVVRHKDNGKWFAAVVEITEDKLGINGNRRMDALLLKCDPLLKGSVVDNRSVFPAYHMNKEHWLTVRLGVPCDHIIELIQMSYQLTQKEKK